MRSYPVSLERLSEQFARLPGIGPKSARRLAFYVLGMTDGEAQAFADAIGADAYSADAVGAVKAAKSFV